MKIVYLGTPDFAVKPLKTIYESGLYEIVGVITNKDKPVGRKQVLTACPVKEYALSVGLKVFQYDKIRLEGVEDLIALAPDLMITCAFGQILSQEILDIPKFGVINIHASLLPKYRGASPIHYAILNGEKKTGVTIMKTDVGIDTGDIIKKSEPILIGEKETCGELFEKLSNVGANMILDVIKDIEKGNVHFVKQNDNEATLTKIIRKTDAFIDFENSNEYIYNQVRAFNPAPIAYCNYFGQPLKIYDADLGDGIGKAGEILDCDKNLEIACGKGSIIIKSLQKSGGKRMSAQDFLRGVKLSKGELLK